MRPASPTQRHTQSGKANRWLLYGPLAIGAVLTVGYYALWNYGADIMRTEVTRFVAEQRTAGLTVEHETLIVSGFPFLLRAELPAPRFSDPAAGWSWQAQSLFIDTLPFNPTKLIISPTGNQTITIPADGQSQSWALEAQTIRASLSQTKMGLELRDLTATALTPATGFPISKITIGLFRVNTLLEDSAITSTKNDTGSLGLEAQKITLSQQDGTNVTITYLDSSLTLTALNALQNPMAGESKIDSWRRSDGLLTIEDLRLIIDDSNPLPPTQLRVSGTFFVDPSDYPAGKVSLNLKDPKTALAILENAGVLAEQERQGAQNLLNSMSSATGGETKAAFTLRGGNLSLGPIKLADLPQVQ